MQNANEMAMQLYPQHNLNKRSLGGSEEQYTKP